MTKSILSQLSIIMTSSFDIVSPLRIRGGIRQVSGWTTAGPRRISGGIRVSRGGIESGQVRGSAGGLGKLSARVSGLVKKTWTVLYVHDAATSHTAHTTLSPWQCFSALAIQIA